VVLEELSSGQWSPRQLWPYSHCRRLSTMDICYLEPLLPKTTATQTISTWLFENKNSVTTAVRMEIRIAPLIVT